MPGDAAADQDGHAIAHGFQFGEQMAVDEDGCAALTQLQKNLADVAASAGIDAVGGFVENNQIGIGAHGLSQTDALKHPLGILGDFSVGPGGHADLIEQFGRTMPARGARSVGQRGEELDDLPAGEIFGKPMVLREIADGSKRGLVADGAIENGAVGAGWPDDGDHDFDEGAFAGTIGAEQTENLAAIDLHGNALQRMDAAAVNLGDILKIDGVAGGGWGHGWVGGILPGEEILG